MKKNVGILIFDDAEVLDFAGPFEVFSSTAEGTGDPPFNVFTFSEHGTIVRAINGLQVLPNYSFDNHPSIDILIISGGSGTKKLLHNMVFLNHLKTLHSNAQLTLCICSGARLLGKLGLFDHKPFATHHQVYQHLTEIAPLAIPKYDQRFVQTADNLYTSGGISAGIDLSFHIVEQLLGAEVAKQTAEYMEYDYVPV